MAMGGDVNRRYCNMLREIFGVVIDHGAQWLIDRAPPLLKPAIVRRKRLALLRRWCGHYCYSYYIFTIVQVRRQGWALESVEDGICSDIENECSGLEITARCRDIAKLADVVRVLEYDDVCR